MKINKSKNERDKTINERNKRMGERHLLAKLQTGAIEQFENYVDEKYDSGNSDSTSIVDVKS